VRRLANPVVDGLINLRGQIISIVDMRVKFRFARADFSAETAIVILDIEHASLGVVVDSVNSVLAVDSDEIGEAPAIESGVSSDYITGVTRKDKKLVLLIDIERTLSAEDQAWIFGKSALAFYPSLR
jgi:purine-binding chemotaxis protein CheW